MYIAIRWLVSLSGLMWLAMCATDYYLEKYYKKLHFDTADYVGFIYKNSVPNNLDINIIDNFVYCISMQHIAFLSGVLSVFLFNRKNELLTFLMKLINQIKRTLAENSTILYCKIQISNLCIKSINIALSKIVTHLSGIFSSDVLEVKKQSSIVTLNENNGDENSNLNIILRNKIKQMKDERKSFGKLLLSTLHENKQIKTQFQLETLAKQRLAQHVDDFQKLARENRSKYFNFQQMYIVSNQENIGLKAQLKKITSDKEEVEKNLMSLMHEVYKSKDNTLKLFCSRLIVNTKNNLLTVDVHSEIQKFLDEPKTRNRLINEQPRRTQNVENSTVICTEITRNDNCVPFLSNGPKLRGLPGEYIWTVKDKYGMIEKLYEYESNFDNGDTMKRIREYTVYFDKDCILDSSNSITAPKSEIASNRFLTNSKAFKLFLQNSNGNMVSSPTPIVCR